MKNRKILLTGGKGYLGGRLVKYFSNFNDYDIKVTSRTAENPWKDSNISIIKVDTNKTDLESILSDVDIVIHLAALDFRRSKENPTQAINVNIKDTLYWLQAARQANVSQFIYFSSIHAYGKALDGNVTENTIPLPVNDYAITHKCAEDYVLSYNNDTTFKTHVFRLSNSFGYPNSKIDQWNLLIPSLCKEAIEKSSVSIKSNPEITRDFISMKSVARIVSYFIENRSSTDSGVYNLSSGTNLTLLQIAKKIQAICSKLYEQNIKINVLSEPEKFQGYLIDNKKLLDTGANVIDFIDEELENFLEYCKNKLLC
jgi:UDP-glucose 4-epimerase